MEGQQAREVVWPRRTGLSEGATYDGRRGTVGAARVFVSDFLDRAQNEHGVAVTAALLEDARLVTSELVTNAAKYAPGPCLLDLDLELDAGILRITLWDTQPSLPVPSEADPARVGRHGLEIVLALCRRFEVERQAGGKRVQVDLEL
ncbi:ATP-binding protein [Streptacidiphilus sp. N1-10]|uniref:ATP-binding protein n=1 Tax=Streptacidiphilus jeojiensis TaxID=3229225 RepID=A0ABV6XR64_9ACTN